MRASELGRGLGLALCIAFMAGPAAAACIAPPLSPEFVNQFKSNPGQLIPGADTDARTVEATARDLAGTDPALAQALVQIAKDTRPRFKAAIAAGLAQAALACMTVDQQAALQITAVRGGLSGWPVPGAVCRRGRRSHHRGHRGGIVGCVRVPQAALLSPIPIFRLPPRLSLARVAARSASLPASLPSPAPALRMLADRARSAIPRPIR